MIFEELTKEIDKDLEILKDRLDDESTRTPILHNKYMRMLAHTKDILNKHQYSYVKLYRDKWLYYSGKADPEVYKENPFQLKVLKGDLSIFMKSDDELSALQYKIKTCELKIELLEKTIGEIGRRSFHISNTIKSLKYYHGDLD